MKHHLGMAFVMLAWTAAGAAQSLRIDAAAGKAAQTLQSLDLRQVHDARLQGLLDALGREGVVVTTAHAAWSAGGADGSVVIVPLSRLSAPDTLLHLFYVPDQDAYLFMQLGRGAGGQAEMRLWGHGRAEMLVSDDEVVMLPAPSARTFRLSDEAHQRLGFGARTADLTRDEILDCLGRVLGVVWNPTTLASLLGSAACTASNVFAFAQTACNCLSMFGFGANNVYAPIGCFTGMARLIACGFARCTPTSTPPPSGGSSCGVGSIGFNQTISGSWSSDCAAVHREGRYARYYAFDLATGGSVRINLRSSTDTFLILLRGRGTGGAFVAENDDRGFLDFNSEIAMSLPAGSYTIEATTYSSRATGSFTLSLSR